MAAVVLPCDSKHAAQPRAGLGIGRRFGFVDLGRFFVAAVHQQRTGFCEVGGEGRNGRVKKQRKASKNRC